jgi:hypothetical protein
MRLRAGVFGLASLALFAVADGALPGAGALASATARPAVSAVAPDSGPAGTRITITGSGFAPGATVVIGQGGGPGGTAIKATEVEVLSPSEIRASTGGEAILGTWNVFVISAGLHSQQSSGDSYTYTRPTVSSVSADTGPTGGGTPITITGTGFLPGASVEIGQGLGAGPTAIPAVDVKVVSPTEITATTGANAKAGKWNVFVLDPLGVKSAANTGDRFIYTQSASTCTTVVGRGQYLKVHDPERVSVLVHASINTSAPQDVQISTHGYTSSFGLRALTSASCQASGAEATFSGEGPARGPAEANLQRWTVKFAITADAGAVYLTASLHNREGGTVAEVSRVQLSRTSIKIS